MGIQYLRRQPYPDDNILEEQKWGELILQSPNGTYYKIVIDNSGNLSTEEYTE